MFVTDIVIMFRKKNCVCGGGCLRLLIPHRSIDLVSADMKDQEQDNENQISCMRILTGTDSCGDASPMTGRAMAFKSNAALLEAATALSSCKVQRNV